MTKDRIGEFKMILNFNKLNAKKKPDNGCKGLQISEVQEEHNWISAMETIVAAIKKIHREMLTTVETSKATQNELENLMANMQMAAFKLREQLNNLESNIKKEEETYKSHDEVPLTNKSEPASLRIMRVKHSTLKHKFCTIMQEYNSIQLEYRDKCRERIRRQLHVIGRDVTDQEMEELLDQPLGTVFADTLMSREAQLTMNDVKARHHDIMKLEQSIRDMQELFLNLSVIVEKQQYIVDNIEYNVSTTQDYIARGKEELKTAKKKRNKIRKKTMCLLVGLVVVVAVVIIIIAV